MACENPGVVLTLGFQTTYPCQSPPPIDIRGTQKQNNSLLIRQTLISPFTCNSSELVLTFSLTLLHQQT